MATTTHEIPVGTKVRVQFGTGHFGAKFERQADGTITTVRPGKFYRAGWRVGTVVGHSAIGQAHRPGGWPTYDVTMRDGNVITNAAAECVKVA